MHRSLIPLPSLHLPDFLPSQPPFLPTVSSFSTYFLLPNHPAISPASFTSFLYPSVFPSSFQPLFLPSFSSFSTSFLLPNHPSIFLHPSLFSCTALSSLLPSQPSFLPSFSSYSTFSCCLTILHALQHHSLLSLSSHHPFFFPNRSTSPLLILPFFMSSWFPFYLSNSPSTPFSFFHYLLRLPVFLSYFDVFHNSLLHPAF